MKKYRVSWPQTTVFYTEVEVGDDANEDDITEAAYRNAQHGDVNEVCPIEDPKYTIEELKDV